MIVPVPIVVLIGVLLIAYVVWSFFATKCIKVGMQLVSDVFDAQKSLRGQLAKAQAERDCNLASWNQATEERDKAIASRAELQGAVDRLSDTDSGSPEKGPLSFNAKAGRIKTDSH